MKKQKQKKVRCNKSIQEGNSCDLDVPIKQGKKIFGTFKSDGSGMFDQEGCVILNVGKTAGIYSEKDASKIPMAIGTKEYPKCDLIGITPVTQYDSKKKKNRYSGVLLFGSKDKKSLAAIDQWYYNDIKKSKVKVNDCNCGNQSNVKFNTNENTSIIIAPRVNYDEKTDLRVPWKESEFIPIKEYTNLNKLKKEELSKKSGLPVKETKDQHIFKILDEKLSSKGLSSKKLHSKKLNEKSKRKK